MSYLEKAKQKHLVVITNLTRMLGEEDLSAREFEIAARAFDSGARAGSLQPGVRDNDIARQLLSELVGISIIIDWGTEGAETKARIDALIKRAEGGGLEAGTSTPEQDELARRAAACCAAFEGVETEQVETLPYPVLDLAKAYLATGHELSDTLDDLEELAQAVADSTYEDPAHNRVSNALIQAVARLAVSREHDQDD